MRYFVVLLVILGMATASFAKDGFPDADVQEYKGDATANSNSNLVTIHVVGQGLAPSFATTPAQSYVLAKRAARTEAYRLIAERIKGVKIEGRDTIKNMALKSSSVNTKVSAMVRNAKIIDTTYKDGICEVELEITIDKNDFK